MSRLPAHPKDAAEPLQDVDNSRHATRQGTASQAAAEPSTSRSARHSNANESSMLRHCLVLLAFCLNTSLNSFCSVNFSVVEKVTRSALNVHDQALVAWFYTGFLLTVCAGMIPGMLMVVHYEGIALGFSVLMNVGCCWVRWLGLQRHSYALCLASVILGGAGAWPILTLPAQLSKRFPPQWWAFTTSLAVQANYTGWLLGSVIPPAAVEDAESMTSFMMWQAIASLAVVMAFIAFYRPQANDEMLASQRTQHEVSITSLSDRGEEIEERQVRGNTHGAHGHGGGHDGGVKDLIHCFFRYPRFGAQVLAYGMLGGVSFSFPGCDDALLEPYGYAAKTVSLVNVAFIATGVVSGVTMGLKVSNPRHYGKVLKILFVACTASLSVIALLFDGGFMPRTPGTRHIVVVAILFSVVGLASLGFIGLGIEAAALYPVGSAYVCFSIEGLVQVFGALLNQISLNGRGFAIIASAAWVSTLFLLAGYHRPIELSLASSVTTDPEVGSSSSGQTPLVPHRSESQMPEHVAHKVKVSDAVQ